MKMPVVGPDTSFPVLDERCRFSFPDPERSEDGVVALGGNLSPGMLLSAYEQGIFPWFGPEDPIIWQSPDPRFIILPDTLHVSDSMRRVLKRGDFELHMDRDFQSVIARCAVVQRPGQAGTWITADMLAAYTELHRLGWAHSAEAYRDGVLVGGCYGLRLGDAFFGESMFSLEPNASKAAFIALAGTLFSDSLRFIDCQVPTDHLRSLGGREVSRREFLARLYSALSARSGAARQAAIIAGGAADEAAVHDEADRRGNWAERYPLFPELG